MHLDPISNFGFGADYATASLPALNTQMTQPTVEDLSEEEESKGGKIRRNTQQKK